MSPVGVGVSMISETVDVATDTTELALEMADLMKVVIVYEVESGMSYWRNK
jgi:hypothetical protein